ncbi:hypothetical protein [uncultured Kordia sp.]|uniref:hypothetical protein n=1 Tax=uncultured Kordia sp. TaxID=507699 RepID=UPI00262DA2EB|nr:hypothetical protein [uncultured Kordia sp.]
MKKKLMNTLKLKKSSIAMLRAKTVTGGNEPSNVDIYCISVNFCETKDFTKCFGENQCQIYSPHTS